MFYFARTHSLMRCNLWALVCDRDPKILNHGYGFGFSLRQKTKLFTQ